jgi:2-oxoglutarate ferredoxin oxidoreductase subunit beta
MTQAPTPMGASPVATTVTPLSTYRNETPYPFCPGCGHGSILDALNRALVDLELDPRKVVLVSDIGCSGLSDQYFATNAFHGLHGRSLTYATGIKLARPELTVVVILGDGGTGIGGAHLLNAARRNVGLTVLVFNNFNYGMTGGQHSATTPLGAVTSTTPGGNLERPLDLCATAAVNGAAYVWRGTNFDGDLAERIGEALRTPGFALLDVWELCTAFFVPNNRASKRTLSELLERLDFERGVLARREVAEYSAAYRQAHAAEREAWKAATAGADSGALQAALEGALEPRFPASLDRRFHFVVAGSAGDRVRSAVRQLARAGVLSGLWATQRDDYPVTVKSGHSVSELVLSPEPIDYTGIRRPDALLLLSEIGRRKASGRLARMGEGGKVFALPELVEELPVPQGVRVEVIDPEPWPRGLRKTHLALMAVARALKELELLPAEALMESVRRGAEEHAERNLEALGAAGGIDSLSEAEAQAPR